MKPISIAAFTIILFSACNKTGKALNEKLVNSDSVAINYFKGDGTMDSVTAVKIITDKATIERLTDIVSGSTNQQVSRCGYDGSMHFFKMNKVIQDINFRDAEECKHFTYLLRGEYHTTPLTRDAKKLLDQLKAK